METRGRAQVSYTSPIVYMTRNCSEPDVYSLPRSLKYENEIQDSLCLVVTV